MESTWCWGAQNKQARPDHRIAPQIETQGGFRAQARRQAGLVAGGARQLATGLRADQLAGFAVDQIVLSAQDLVARHQGVQSGLQRVGVQRAAQAQGQRDVVGRRVRRQVRQRPQAALGAGLRENIGVERGVGVNCVHGWP
ncbi:hypothetical protein JOS77_18275 [Chromobacterium haemolyticum]|nr:hypothetical protein JOS77_18275 [Chromobacterium haemolyticum]